MNEAEIANIMQVLGGEKDFKVSFDTLTIVYLVLGVFVAVLVATVLGSLIVKRFG